MDVSVVVPSMKHGPAIRFTLRVKIEILLKLQEPLGECNLKEFSNITSSENRYDWENNESAGLIDLFTDTAAILNSEEIMGCPGGR